MKRTKTFFIGMTLLNDHHHLIYLFLVQEELYVQNGNEMVHNLVLHKRERSHKPDGYKSHQKQKF
jgi:hypothetical protein